MEFRQYPRTTAFQAFRIVVHHDKIKPKQNQLPWTMEEAEIRLIESISIPTASSNPREPVLQFQLPSAPNAPVGLPPHDMAEIRDLCQSLHSLRSMQCDICIGYMVGASNQRRHGLYSPKKRFVDEPSLSVETLANVMNKPALLGIRWTNGDARPLAVPLAAGILRLTHTLWMEQAWSKNDITLIRKDNKVLSSHPFVSQDMSMQTPSVIVQDSSIARAVIRNQSLFALGVVLIELCMEKTIDELRSASELNSDGTKHSLSDYQTACRLLDLEEISDNSGQRWSDVVRRCIYCDLNHAKTSLEDIGFQKAVYNGIFIE